MLLIAGLGNPGEKYASTRHNIGFMVIDKFFKNQVAVENAWQEDKNKKVFFYKTGDIILAKPVTFMNASGVAVRKLVDLYKIKTENIWVIHDDIDLPIGKIRIRRGGGSAGHHGVDSIMRELGGVDTFVRFRLGVGRGKLEQKKHSDQFIKRQTIEKYVVSHFADFEAGSVRTLIKHAVKAIELALQKGLDRAMNEYN
jgi:peptidyl-tRNA hydrolase, PTH1 family